MPDDTRKPGRTSWRDGVPDQPTANETPHHSAGGTEPVGNKWRSRQRAYQPEGELPPLPEQKKRRQQGGVGNRAIIFGAVLLLIVAALIILPFTPLLDGDDDPAPTPTSEVAQATQAVTAIAADNVTSVPTNEPAETVDSDFLVCIDPGHGGWDRGRERTDMDAFGPPWVDESELTLSLAYFLRDELEQRGIAVVMTRETGGAVNWANEDVDGDGRVLDTTEQGQVAGLRDELQARISICNDAGADIMVSVHLNGADDPAIGGYQIYYNSHRDFAAENNDLAAFLYREMTIAFSDLGYAANERGTTDDINLSAQTHEFGSEQFLIMIGPEVVKPEYTIVPTRMPGVIIETLFITHTDDANFIMNPANQQRLAVAWADGIENYRAQYGDGE